MQTWQIAKIQNCNNVPLLEYGEPLSETKLIWYDANVLAKDGGMATLKLILNQISKMWCRLDESKIQCGFIN